MTAAQRRNWQRAARGSGVESGRRRCYEHAIKNGERLAVEA